MRNKKTGTGERIVYLYTKLLRVSREEFLRLYPIGRSTLISIENEVGGLPSLEKMITELQLNPTWVREGKGSVWLSGTEAENAARIKQGNKQATTTESPWKDEAYIQIKQERDRLLDDVSKYKQWINRIMNGEINFLAPLGNKASYSKLKVANE